MHTTALMTMHTQNRSFIKNPVSVENKMIGASIHQGPSLSTSLPTRTYTIHSWSSIGTQAGRVGGAGGQDLSATTASGLRWTQSLQSKPSTASVVFALKSLCQMLMLFLLLTSVYTELLLDE